MPDSLLDLAEIRGLHGAAAGLVRIPPGVDVPITPRVRQLIDAPEFRRLAQISQLGLVSLVYPAANHTRQEHSLGVYRTAIEYIQSLAADERFAAAIRPQDAELFLVAALLHDLGHWPFCHPIEEYPPATDAGARAVRQQLLARRARSPTRSATTGASTPRDVVDAPLWPAGRSPKGRLLRSILSGPIDVDKIGLPGPRQPPRGGAVRTATSIEARLIAQPVPQRAGRRGLAITEKGKTAAELMVFARYVMFSEVYWHHAVRSRHRDAAKGVLHACIDGRRHSTPCFGLTEAADDRVPPR